MVAIVCGDSESPLPLPPPQFCTKINSHFPANIYLFKVNNRNTRKNLKYVQSLQYKHQNDAFSSVSIV